MPWIPIGTIVFRYSMERPIGNPETRRQRRAENSMFDQIDNAVDLRVKAEEDFKEQIVSQLKDLIMKLDECDPSNARTVLDLTQQQLGSIITKLNNTNAITSAEATNIVNTVRESNLLRRPSALPIPPLTVPSLPVPPLTVPSLPTPPLTVPSALPKRDLSVINPGAVPSNGRNPGLTPGRRGGRKTRRKGKSKRIV